MSLSPFINSPFNDSVDPFTIFIPASTHGSAKPNEQPSSRLSVPWPRMDLFHTESNITAVLELPAVDRKDIEIQHDPIKSTVTISGSVSRPEQPKDATFVRSERITGNYSRSFSVPQGTKDQDIKPTLENGLLRVVCPRRTEKSEARKIEIA